MTTQLKSFEGQGSISTDPGTRNDSCFYLLRWDVFFVAASGKAYQRRGGMLVRVPQYESKTRTVRQVRNRPAKLLKG